MASEVRAREFTASGIAEARKFLGQVRKDPMGRKSPPKELLEGAEYTRQFRGELTVARRWHPFASRREVGEYLAPRLEPFRTSIADRTSFWSWIGMFHFEDTVRIVDGAVQLSPLDETFVIDPMDRQNLRGIHRHGLRSAWLVYEVHGEDAPFLLDQSPWARGDIADRILQSQRIFNSAGVVPLILRLYTDGNRQKRGFQGRPGGLRHLLRVLDQLERTYDIYGMNPDALVRILPPDFAPWANGTADATNLRLRQWEGRVRKKGRGTMRYKRFRAAVRIEESTGALHGTITSPDSDVVGTLSAPESREFKRVMRRQVDEHIAREGR